MWLWGSGHVVCYDVWFFVSHICLHHPRLYWIHKRHHENRFPTWKDTYHESGLESMLQSLGFFVPWIWTVDWKAALLAAAFLNIRGMMQHDTRTAWIVGRHHLDHHEWLDGNYGQKWLDDLFGTTLNRLRRPRLHLPPRLPTPECLEDSTAQETHCTESTD